MSLRWVRKRDGRRAPFDPRKLGDSVSVAARAAGEEARVPHEEIVEITALFLEQRFKERIPETSDIMDLVEKALLETGHARTASVYAGGIKARAKTRRELVVHRDGSPVAPDGEPLLAPRGDAWAEGKIVASLERRRVPPAVAEEVAAAVEQKVFALGFKRIPASLVREIVNAELADRGMSAYLGRPHELTVPTEEVRQLLVAAYVRRAGGEVPSAPGGAEAAVGQDVLARFALAEIYPPGVADAHLEGRIHIQDLGRPLRLTSAAIALDALKARAPFTAASTGAGAEEAASREGPRNLGELGGRLARTIALLSETHARAITIPYANIFLAPFLRRNDSAARKELLDWVRLLPAAGVRPIVRLHIGAVPPTLAAAPVVGPHGRRWRATYGDLVPQVERCARLLLEALAEDAAMRLGTSEPGAAARGRAGSGGIGVILGLCAPGEPTPGLPPRIALAPPFTAATLEGRGLEPQRVRGLATPSELILAAQRGTAVAAGAAAVVALSCPRAAAVAGPGDEPAFRRELFAAADLAVEALAAKWAFLEPALYRPKLPLWQQQGKQQQHQQQQQQQGNPVGSDSSKADLARLSLLPAAGEPAIVVPSPRPGPLLLTPSPRAVRPLERPAVNPEHAVQVVALVGFTEAVERVLGETPAANAAVATAAGEIVKALATRLREQGALRGLRVRIEEPEIERGRRRLTDLDLVRASGAPGAKGVEEADLRYSHGLGGALVEPLYAPLALAPFLEGGDIASRVSRLLERSVGSAATGGAAAPTPTPTPVPGAAEVAS